MDETAALPVRQRLVIALVAVVVVVLSMLRPTADVSGHLDGVNQVPVGPTVFPGAAAAGTLDG
ncbi:MAG: hypothetical protein KDB35_08230 [Acidimicrobiales bacterium]|nr:hypothetical protein [Acidimicrobiales bacterium]MCB9372906.1 hypothetical protein [Microthrixaceae bacterium]